MSNRLSRNVSKIRDGWSDQERKERRSLAGAMQLQLRALVVLSELATKDAEREPAETMPVVTAC